MVVVGGKDVDTGGQRSGVVWFGCSEQRFVYGV